MTILFISDLHLSATHPDITDCLLDFLAHEAPKAQALYVLGDLFEFWIGDDDLTPFHQRIIRAFNRLSSKGMPIYFVHGNRDFLIGKQLADACGFTLLPAHYVIDLFGTPTLIMHGDTLCTDDIAYQNYRKKVNNPFLQWLFLQLPLFFRTKIGNKIRSVSEKKKIKTTDAQSISDVVQADVIRTMQDYGVTQLIHGHTHCPDIHEVILANHIKGRRIVLGDWYTQGSILVCDENGCTLETRDFSGKKSADLSS